MATAAGRRYIRRFMPTMFAYVAVLFGCVWAIHNWKPQGPGLIVLSVLPALPIISAIVVMGLYLIEETDEFLRQRIASCMLFGTGVLLAVATVYGFLVNGGAVEVNDELFLWAFPLWCASWGLAQCVIGMRDHLAGGGE
jgi:phosphoglycerol transferase MdoB-like AlkP superfamily enzyme